MTSIFFFSLALVLGMVANAETEKTKAVAQTLQPIVKKNTEYSVQSRPVACVKDSEQICSMDTFVTARAIDNQELLWERRIYFETLSPIAADKISLIKSMEVKSFTAVGKNMLRAKNSRGDVFDLEMNLGHMKSPKTPREYKP